MRRTRRPATRYHFRRFSMLLLICSIVLGGWFSDAWAGPEGARVVNGLASFQQNGLNTTIHASDQAIINYTSFDIARPEVVQFVQPGSGASVLNRILSAGPTSINGTLLANGRVFFVNPAGVYIGSGASINVNQLVASGFNMSDESFISGRYEFAGGNGTVSNYGSISANSVYLVGKQVTNAGNIHCPGGYVVMAAGDRVFLGEPGSDVMVEVGDFESHDSPAPQSQDGIIRADGAEGNGGNISLQANKAVVLGESRLLRTPGSTATAARSSSIHRQRHSSRPAPWLRPKAATSPATAVFLKYPAVSTLSWKGGSI